MSFRINTNITAMRAYTNSLANDTSLSKSLGKLSSGLQIQNAADDASGMTIADSLRSQSSALGQAIKNANDAAGIIQVADNAMNQQIEILDTVKTKATQAAQDGQSTASRAAIQSDISHLLEELDNIANTTSFNGQVLLNGNFNNKNFQIGAYSNETVKVNIGATQSEKIGLTRFESSAAVSYKISHGGKGGLEGMKVDFKLTGIDGFPKGYVFESVSGKAWAELGFKAIADRINAMGDQTGVKASVNNKVVMTAGIQEGHIKGLKINGAMIGNMDIEKGDANGALVNAINKVKEQTGVVASVKDGKLTLRSMDGRVIRVEAHSTAGVAAANGIKTVLGLTETISAGDGTAFMGKLNLVRQDARDIMIKISTSGSVTAKKTGFQTTAVLISNSVLTAAGKSGIEAAYSGVMQASINLHDMNTGVLSAVKAAAMGFFAVGEDATKDQASGVTTYEGAQAMIDIAESAQKLLDHVRSDLGSAQNQLTATIANITVTQVNVKASESQIRDVDFASEASKFNKFNILAQSGSYAMSQANTVQQNVMKLLQ